MKPLKIIAHLKSGFSASFDFALSIDGIIAYQSQLEKLGWDEFVSTQSSGQLAPVDDLPIEKEHWNEDWWYQCSRPFFDCKLQHSKHIHRRFNAFEAEKHVNKVTSVETTKGAYKNARLSVKLFVTPQVLWYVNGDKARIEHLLSSVTHIGAKRGSGHGAVSRWEVLEHDNVNDCCFKRIVPLDFAQAHNMQGMQLDWAIRPPYSLPANKRLCVVPNG